MRPEVVVVALSAACIPKIERGAVPIDEAAAPVAMITRPDPSAPTVYLQAVVRAGSAWDPPGQEGLAALTARAMVDAGAGDRSGQQIRDALFPTGNGFEVVVDREYASIRLRCHVDHAELCAELFTDVLTRPTFRDADVLRLAEQAVHAVGTGMLTNEEELGGELFHSILYEGHPYGHPVRGRTGSLPLLDGEATRAFHADRYRRSTVTVGLAGGFQPEWELSVIEDLGRLPTGIAQTLTLPPPNQAVGRGLIAVDTSTAVTGFHLGHAIEVDRNHPDWPALVVGITAFGAHRQSFGRLFRAMRGDRGLNYGDYAYAEPFVQRGWQPLPEQGVRRRDNHFLLWIRPTSVQNGPFALKLAIHELERLAESGLTPEEFKATVAYLERNTALEAVDAGRRLAYALDAAVSGTPDVLDHLPRSLGHLELADVNDALKRHLRPDDLWIVAVSGEADQLAAALLEEQPTPIVYVDVVPGADQAARDASIAASPLGLDPGRVHVLPAEGVFR